MGHASTLPGMVANAIGVVRKDGATKAAAQAALLNVDVNNEEAIASYRVLVGASLATALSSGRRMRYEVGHKATEATVTTQLQHTSASIYTELQQTKVIHFTQI